MYRKSSSWLLRIMSLVVLLSLMVMLVGDVVPPTASADEAGDGSAARGGDITPAQTTKVRVLRKFQNAEIDFSAQSGFRLTAVSTREEDKAYSPKFTDEAGAVQLMPVVELDPFTPTGELSQLPVYLNAMGVTSLGKYLFVIGGVKRIAGEQIGSQRSNEVLVATVDQKTGQLSGVDALTGKAWRFAPPLPPVWTNYPGDDSDPGADPGEFGWSEGTWNDTFAPVSEVASPAVVAVPRSSSLPDSGFIYVIGGTVDPGFYNDKEIRITTIPSARVQIGKVEQGVITEWLYHDEPGDPISKDIMIPSPIDEGETYGLTGATALTFTTIDNRTFIYLIGGNHTIPERTHHSNYVFYTEVNRQTGLLYKPSSNRTIQGWEIMRDTGGNISRIPTPPESDKQSLMGLWNATAFIGSTNQGDALYVVGGERLTIEDEYRYSNAVYRARITNELGNQGNGKLTWDTVWKTHLPSGPLINLGSATYATSVYLTGGNAIEGGVAVQPTSDVLISFLNEDLSLGPEGASIYGLPHKEGDPPPLFRSRAQHGMTVVKSVGAGNVQAFVYAIAGHSSVDQKDPDDPYSHQNTNTVLFSKVDLANQKKIYPPYGWYTSPTVDTIIGASEQQEDLINLEGLYWSAAVSRTQEITTDIALEYRVKPSSGGCDTVSFEEADWKKFYQADLATTYSREGSNIAILQPEDVQSLKDTRACFQYRARMTTNDPEATPLLLNTYLAVSEDKIPDLYGVNRAIATTTGMDLAIEVWNLNEGSVQKTADADFIRGKSKKFFVDLFLFTPGQSSAPLKATTLPVIGDQGLTALNAITATLHLYSQIDKSVMKAGKTFPDPPENQGLWSGTSQWTDPITNQPLSKTLREVLQDPKFNVTGIYTVCVLVDSFVNNEDAYDWGQTGYVVEGNETNNLDCREVDRETEVSLELDTDTPATEKGQKQGRFVIARNISPDKELVVNLAITGTATYEVDYTFSDNLITDDGKTGHVVIPANQQSVELVFTPIDDSLSEGNETVIVNLWTGSYMLVRDKMSATAVIYDDDWFLFLPMMKR